MRGARIAEKIQEYYHSNSNIGQTNNHSNYINQNSKQSSMYAAPSNQKNEGQKAMKQFV